MRLRLSRPRKLSTWLFLALGLMLAPQFIGAAVGISQQQAQINDAREDGRQIATRLGRIAHLQSTLDATEDAILRAPGDGRDTAGPRVRGTLARANADVLVLDSPVLTATSPACRRSPPATSPRPRDRRRLEAPLDRVRAATAAARGRRRWRRTTADEVSDRADQRTQLLGITLAFIATLMLTLLIARLFISSIRRPLRTLRTSAVKLGSGDLDHRAELDSFAEFNQVADAFNTMADALRQSDHELNHRAFHDPLTGLANRALLVRPHRRMRSSAARRRGDRACCSSTSTTSRPSTTASATPRRRGCSSRSARRLRGVLRAADTVARLGGDEFAILLEDLTEPDGRRGRRRADPARALQPGQGRRAASSTLAASIGVAVSGAELRRRRRAAARRRPRDVRREGAGKGRYPLVRAAMLPGAVERLALERDLQPRSLRDELELHYQPIVDLATGRVARLRGARALDASGARPARPGRVHPARRGDRADRAARRLGAARGVPPTLPALARAAPTSRTGRQRQRVGRQLDAPGLDRRTSRRR